MTPRGLLGLVSLAMSAATAACSQAATPVASPARTIESKGAAINQVVPGSYIVRARGDGEAAIRRVFAHYGVLQVTPLGNEQFELRLERDPGLDALKNLAAGSGGAVIAIQPNFVYHGN